MIPYGFPLIANGPFARVTPRPSYGMRGIGADPAKPFDGHAYPAWTMAGVFERAGMSSDTALTTSYVLQLGAVVADTYHGYKRNKSVGWAVGWAVAALFFPVITTTVAIAEGFAKPKGA